MDLGVGSWYGWLKATIISGICVYVLWMESRIVLSTLSGPTYLLPIVLQEICEFQKRFWKVAHLKWRQWHAELLKLMCMQMWCEIGKVFLNFVWLHSHGLRFDYWSNAPYMVLTHNIFCPCWNKILQIRYSFFQINKKASKKRKVTIQCEYS